MSAGALRNHNGFPIAAGKLDERPSPASTASAMMYGAICTT